MDDEQKDMMAPEGEEAAPEAMPEGGDMPAPEMPAEETGETM